MSSSSSALTPADFERHRARMQLYERSDFRGYLRAWDERLRDQTRLDMRLCLWELSLRVATHPEWFRKQHGE